MPAKGICKPRSSISVAGRSARVLGQVDQGLLRQKEVYAFRMTSGDSQTYASLVDAKSSFERKQPV